MFAVMEMIVPALIISGCCVVLPLSLFFVTFFLWPAAIIKAYNWNERRKMRLVVHNSFSGSYRFSYFSNVTPGGSTPSLLLLHGFSDKKDSWLPLIKYLPKNQHIVAVDMPGHGGTSRPDGEDYSIEGQVVRIHQFVQSIGLNKRPFHLVGISMGGNVAGVYAARYPAHLSGVTLICPSGIDYPTDSEFISQLRELEHSHDINSVALVPKTVDEFENMLRLCCHTQLNIPRQIINGILSERIPNNEFYKEVLMEIVSETSRYSLQDKLHLISTPLQVIWGKEDKLLDVSGTTVVQAALPCSQVELLDNCGHNVPMERPRKSAKLIMDFMTACKFSINDDKKHS
ncbi:monoacylglycerol lipase abhd6-B [Cynoglossus semilaevis]|uniref:Abhydrolase domain containing 6, acylglycerol lipase n=1 Tax=Cynoglossus semilaevis TaxID=244447 RepID=A0A3P8WQF5_CYNSE|nr:monoacylglycerol lipase ABHD6 [Cynoglossus semilaevis]